MTDVNGVAHWYANSDFSKCVRKLVAFVGVLYGFPCRFRSGLKIALLNRLHADWHISCWIYLKKRREQFFLRLRLTEANENRNYCRFGGQYATKGGGGRRAGGPAGSPNESRVKDEKEGGTS